MSVEPSTMKAVVFDGPFQVSVQDVPKPACKCTQDLVQPDILLPPPSAVRPVECMN